MNFPVFDQCLPFLNRFILELVEGYREGKINSWDALDEKVKSFFTPERMDQMETLVPGWQKMSSYSDGVTRTHVMCVFLGVYMMPEFQALTPEGQQLAKWFVLFHDLDKFHIAGKKDPMHAFRSAALTAPGLARFDFPVTEKYHELINSWRELTFHACITRDGESAPKPDNRKLPEILNGLDVLFGENAPATLITKTVLFHISLDVDPNYLTPAPLTEAEIKRYIDPTLFPLLKVMMLGDNEGWAMFEPEGRKRLYDLTVAAFQRFEKIIAA